MRVGPGDLSIRRLFVGNIQIEIAQDDRRPDRIHVAGRFFGSFGAPGAGQQVFIDRDKLGFVYDHSKVITLQVVVVKVVHAGLVVRLGKSSKQKKDNSLGKSRAPCHGLRLKNGSTR